MPIYQAYSFSSYHLPLILSLTLWFRAWAQLDQPFELHILGWDKMAHFLVYGLLALGWFLYFRGRGSISNNKWLSVAFFLTVFVGAIDECIQYSNPFRSFELWDLLADALGALAVLLFARSKYLSIR